MSPEIRIKPGVNMAGLSPMIWRVAWKIAGVFERNGVACVITSARRDPGKKKSYHATGEALDFRANHISREPVRLKILAEIIGVCGADYDVILHGEGDNIHYHVEYDPKEG